MQHPVSLWDKFGFAAAEKESQKKLQMPYGSYLQSLWAQIELDGKWFASESSHVHKATMLA